VVGVDVVTSRLVVTAVVVVAVVGAGVLVERATSTSASGSIRLLQFNICGHACNDADSDKVAGVVDALADVRPAAAGLNEVCSSQLTAIVDGTADRGWAMRGRFVVAQPHACTDGADYGNAVLTRTRVIDTDRLIYAAQDPGNPEHRALLCVEADLGGRPTHICSTHISDSTDDPVGDIRRAQIALAARQAGSYRGPVVLMGDFNARPRDRAMSVVYTKRHGGGGTGKFDEIGQGPGMCRCGEPTHGSRAKYDYIFVSHRDFAVVDGDVRSSPFSDHQVLLGRVTER
jgi:endonuclease/exonuclease/phosphatase family metal-dependent hydrolase